MRKIVSFLLVVVMVLSLSGCSSRYPKIEKKVIAAAESCCGAEEADKKQRKMIKGATANLNDPEFSDGVYFTISKDEVDDISFGLITFDPDYIKQMLFFVKSEDSSSYLITLVFDMRTKSAAEDVYDYCYDDMGITKKELKAEAKRYGSEYGIMEEKNEFAVIMVSKKENQARGVYIKRAGTAVIACNYQGSTTGDLYEEFLDFSNEAGFVDMEALLGE